MKRAAFAAQRADLTDSWLAEIDLPVDAGWSVKSRERALGRLRDIGLPLSRDEYWKYTNPRSLISDDLPPFQPRALDTAFAEIDALRIVFVDGKFDANKSDDLSGEHLTITRLSDVAAMPPAGELYGELEAISHTRVPRPLAALNSALATEGVIINVTGAVSRPVLIQYERTANGSDVLIHHVLRLEQGALLNVLEEGDAGARSSIVIEAELADQAKLHHIRIQGNDPQRLSYTAIFGRIASEALFKSFTLAMNGQLMRNEIILDMLGDNTVAHVAGASIGNGSDYIHDDTVFVTHDALNGESRQVFKKVLRNGATGVFQGKILVQEGAQKTDGYQISQSLLLDNDAQFLGKPELEIYADDVACSHGSTTGAIDDRGLFYLRSRGVSKPEAVRLLTLAFLAEALDEVEDDRLRELLLERLSIWLTEPG